VKTQRGGKGEDKRGTEEGGTATLAQTNEQARRRKEKKEREERALLDSLFITPSHHGYH
jgi:hypothetical protein